MGVLWPKPLVKSLKLLGSSASLGSASKTNRWPTVAYFLSIIRDVAPKKFLWIQSGTLERTRKAAKIFPGDVSKLRHCRPSGCGEFAVVVEGASSMAWRGLLCADFARRLMRGGKLHQEAGGLVTLGNARRINFKR